MKKHLLLFAALFAIVSGNNLFAENEASGHLSGASVYNPETQNLTALSLPVSINSITAENVNKTVWFPYDQDSLVFWEVRESAIVFAGQDLNSNINDKVEHPFIIRLDSVAKTITVDLRRPYGITSDNDGGGFRIFEWNGTAWVKIKDTNGWHNPAQATADISTSTRYLMIAPYNHAGASRKLHQLDITKFAVTPDFTLTFSQAWESQSVNKSVAKNITPSNLNDGAKVAAWTAEISGDDTGMFAVTSCNASTGVCEVTYTPTAAGNHNATLTLTATCNVVSPAKVTQKTVALTGTGDATPVIEIIKQGTISTSHDFGSVIGLNAATSLTLTVSKYGVASDLAYEWKTADDAFGYTVNGSQLTITAKPKAAQDAQSVHTGVLTVKGKSAGSESYDVTKDFTVTLTVNPRTIPTKTWNIGTTLFERNEYSNIFTTNSDATLSVSVGDANPYLSYANNILTTGAIASSPQAAGSITITAPATDTYAEINEVLSNISLISNPAFLPLNINSKEIFDLVNTSSSQKVSWDATNGVVRMHQDNNSWSAENKDFVFLIKSAPFKLSFTINASTESNWGGTSTPKLKIYQGTTTNDLEQLGSDQTFSTGSLDIDVPLNSGTRCVRIRLSDIKGDGTLSNIQVSASTPTLTVPESPVEMKANANQVYDKTVNFSVLKYASIKVKIEGDNFGLVKGDVAATSEITFTSADDGLNDNNTTQCSFKVRYSATASGAIGKTATIKFFDDKDHQIGSALSVSIAAVPVLTFEAPANGYYTYKYGSEAADTVNSADVKRDLAEAPYEVTLSATPASGYKFLGWYETNGVTRTYLSTSNPYTPTISTTKKIGAAFVTTSTPIFIVKGQEGAYQSLNAACTAAASSSNNIVVLASDGTLAAGEYTIPQNVTLLIPYESTYDCRKENANVAGNQAYVKQSVYRTLTIAPNASITVNGNIEVGGKLCNAYSQGSNSGFPGNCCLTGTYGRIIMDEGSHIELNNGSNLYAWGLIIQKENSVGGTITAGSGSTVYEPFQITDFSGGSALDNWYNRQGGTKNFMYSQYYVQNVEVPLTFEFGSKEKVQMAIYPSSEGKTQINYIGNDNQAMFQIYSGGTITKSYSPAKDRQSYEVNGTTAINDLVISVSGKSMSTSKYRLPLTNNMSISIKSGTTTINANMVMLADAEATIAVGAELILATDKSIWLYDKDQWGKTYDFVTNYIAPLQYAWPNATYRTYATMEDARICVDGKLTINGYLFTTEGGANIYSAQSGTIALNKAPLASTSDYTLHPMTANGSRGGTNTYADIAVTPAQLKNANGEYTSTSALAAGTKMVYSNGTWTVQTQKETISVNESTVKVNEGSPESIEDKTYEITEPTAAANVTIQEGATIEVSAPLEVTNTLVVEEGSTLQVEETATVEVEAIALSTTPSAIALPDGEKGSAGASSQIKGSGTINATNVYIDIHMDPSGKLNDNLYYAFAVPFKVNANGGVQKNINGTLSAAVIGTDYWVYTYQGDKRAEKGKVDAAWKEVTSSEQFIPGVFYLVAFNNSDCNTFRFTKADGNLNNAADINLAEHASSNGTDAGWNGIANNSLQNASFTSAATVVQVFEPSIKKFTTVNLSNTTFAIGTPFFVQATGAGQKAANSVVAASAPARHLAAQENEEVLGNYTLRIKAEGATKMADQLFVSASEDASTDYVIGKDLTKMFMGNASVAQLWVNDYGKKLAMNQAVLNNGVANASLTLYAPKAGNYQVYLNEIPEDATIYLLEKGTIVACLNNGAYSATLSAGENTNYGLRISAKNKPNVTTSLDEALVNGTKAQKVLLNGIIYIVRDGQLYNTLGQKQ